MPQVPSTPADYYMVVALGDVPTIDRVWGAAQVWVVNANSEEEAVALVAKLHPDVDRFLAQVAPLFPAPEVTS